MKILYYVMNNNLKNKYQCNDAIEYDPKFDDKFSLSSVTPMDTFTLVTVRLIGGKKNRAKIISGLICLWGSGDIYRLINMKHFVSS